jgi:hypothetical protein
MASKCFFPLVRKRRVLIITFSSQNSRIMEGRETAMGVSGTVGGHHFPVLL